MVSIEICRDVLSRASATGADFAELFVEEKQKHNINMLSMSVRGIDDVLSYGAAVRVFKGLKCVMATTVDTTREGLMRCAGRAAEALGEGFPMLQIVLHERVNANVHPVRAVPSAAPNKEKIDILREAVSAAKGYDDSIVQVDGNFLDNDRRILVANTEGLYTTDRQISTRLLICATAEHDGETQNGNCRPGRAMGLEMFETISPSETGIQAARQAVTMSRAGYCKAGMMPVAIDNGFGGVIFHEACGHSLEATSVAYGRSEFTGKLGQQIANTKLTAIDDGTIPSAWGSVNIDDEGTPSQRNVLIENGILKSYMIDKFNGRRMGMKSTGSSRRQSYAYSPTSRMTNTYIAAGTDKNEDIIASIEYGLYAKDLGGGSVNPVTGEFNFAVTEGYMIRGGKIAEPVRGASLVGTGSHILMDIDMIGTDMVLGQGMCGSSSGMIPVNVGQPLIRVKNMTVGGR